MNFVNKNAFLKSELFGFGFGILLVLAQINIVYGLPFVLFSLIFLSKRIALDKNDGQLFFLVVLQLMWFTFMYVFFPVNVTHWRIYFALFLIIATVIISKVDYNFIVGVCFSMIMLFLLDFSFNLSTIFTGKDPLGRSSIFRPDDIVQRLGGIFGHSFFSLNISFVGFVTAYIKRYKPVMILAIINIILIGTLRGFILLVMLLTAFYVIKKGISFLKIKIVAFLFIISVFAVTVYTMTLNFSESNINRVYAWSNSIDNIAKNPFFGRQDFNKGPIEIMSFDNIADYGITESQYLEIAVHYGIFPLTLFLIIMILMLRKSFSTFTSSNKIIAISTFIIFTDSFYGSIYGMPLTTVFFTLLIFSEKTKINFAS